MPIPRCIPQRCHNAWLKLVPALGPDDQHTQTPRIKRISFLLSIAFVLFFTSLLFTLCLQLSLRHENSSCPLQSTKHRFVQGLFGISAGFLVLGFVCFLLILLVMDQTVPAVGGVMCLIISVFAICGYLGAEAGGVFPVGICS